MHLLTSCGLLNNRRLRRPNVLCTQLQSVSRMGQNQSCVSCLILCRLASAHTLFRITVAGSRAAVVNAKL